MPEKKHPKCPKGERYDNKTKKCVKVKKSSPKKETPKKKSPKQNNTKKASPSKKNSPSRNTRSASPIPKLAGLKPDMSDYEYKYFKMALGRVEEGEAEEGFVHKENKAKHTFTSFYKLKDIVNVLEEEIDNINKTHCTGGPKHDDYCFSLDKSEKIIKQLNKYITYFKKCADKSGRLDKTDYFALYK